MFCTLYIGYKKALAIGILLEKQSKAQYAEQEI